ncbi:MAG: tripartite tricarboxylate transporter TctB family protein [Betaproteobacteria bacterium]|nr:tripartite tricarboxylate transporter TctB family protein [Betaproteobacteria bacterium]
MKTKLSYNLDFLAGLLMICTGAVGFYMALDYPYGSALRMGPGYFPRVLAGIMIAFGVWIGLRGLRTQEPVKGIWGWRPLFWVTLAMVVFGWMMERAGFVPSLVALFFIASLAGYNIRWKEVTILTIVMILFAWGVFVYGLGLPYRLFWW